MVKKLSSLLVLLALVALASSGCYRHSFGERYATGPSQYAKWSHNILWGFISVDGHTDAGICGGAPPVRMATYVGPVGLLLGIVTAGIYVPTTTQVWCGQGTVGETPSPTGEPDEPGEPNDEQVAKQIRR